MLDYEKMCLPQTGTLYVTPSKMWTVAPGVIIPNPAPQPFPYSIIFGSWVNCLFFKYDENGYGHGLQLAESTEKAALIGSRIISMINKDHIVPGVYESGYKDTFRNIRGHYLLMDLQIDPHRPDTTRKVILFIGNKGETYQHYSSNVMKSDEEVLAAFAEMVSEHERPERERKAAEANREEMFFSGAM